MGIDIKRFIGNDYKPFVCPACTNVVKDPVVISCGHTVCTSCIVSKECPCCSKQFQEVKQCSNEWFTIYKSLKLRCLVERCYEALTVANYEDHDAICSGHLSTSPPCCLDGSSGLGSGHDCAKFITDEFMALQVGHDRQWIGDLWEQQIATMGYECIKVDPTLPVYLCKKCAMKGDVNQNEFFGNTPPRKEQHCHECWEQL